MSNNSMLAEIARAAGLDTVPLATRNAADRPTAPDATRPAEAHTQAAVISLNEDIIRTWKADAGVRAEFHSLSIYASWREHEHLKQTGKTRDQLRNETPDVAGYVDAIEARKGHLTAEERGAIERYAATWHTSRDIRVEFTSFEIYAAYMAATEAGLVRIFGRKGA